MAEIKQDLLKRIKKLLAVTSARGATEGEATAAASKVREILDRYNLDMSQLGLQEEDAVNGYFHQSTRRKFPAWQVRIAHGIAAYYDCRLAASKTGPVWIGFKTDVEVCCSVFEFILQQVHVMKEVAWYEVKARNPQLEGHAITDSYYKGISDKLALRFGQLVEERKRARFVEQRMKELREEEDRCDEILNGKKPRQKAAKENPANQLVIYEAQKEAKVNAWMNENMKDAPKWEDHHYGSHATVVNGYEFGARDGSKVQLNNRQIEE